MRKWAGSIDVSDERQTTNTRLALIEQTQQQMSGKLDDLLELARSTNGRVNKVEQQEIVCQASGVIGLPQRVVVLEDAIKEMRTVARVAKWAVGGGLAGVAALIAQILSMVK